MSCTSNPLWCKNPWLGPLFSASAISTGAETINLVLDCTRGAESAHEACSSRRVLQSIDTLAHATEAVCMAGFQRTAVDRGGSLRRGSAGTAHRIAIGALVAVSAPSSLAVEFALESGQTLVGFLRGRRMNVYAHPQRVAFIPS